MSQITTLKYPINGIDIATGGVSDSVSNCNDALNVRARSALTKQVQGGKRAGLVKLLTAAAGSSVGTRRITGLAAMQRPAQSVQPLQLTTVEVSDDMSMNDGSRWALNRYFAFRKVAPGDMSPSTSRAVFGCDHPNNLIYANGVPRVLSIVNYPRTIRALPTPSASTFTMDSGIVIDAATGNDIMVTLRGRRASTYTNPTDGDASTASADSYESSDCGPFINASEDLTQYYYAYIHVVSTNVATFRIDKVVTDGSGTTASRMNESQEFSTGSSTTVDNGSDNATIRIYSNSAKVYATLDWGVAGIALSLDADIDSTLTTFNRGGILNTRNTNGCFRQIWQARYKRRVEPSRKTFWSVSKDMDMPGQTTQPTWAVPPDTTATTVRSGGMVAGTGNTQTNNSNTWSTSASEPNHPYLDCLNNYIAALLNATTGDSGGDIATGANWWPMLCTSKTFDAAKTYAAEILLNWDRQRVPVSGSTNDVTAPAFPLRDEMTVLFRLDHTDRKTGFAFTFRRKYLTQYINTTSPPDNSPIFRQSSDHLLEWRLLKFNSATGSAANTTIASGIGFNDGWIYPNNTWITPNGAKVGHQATINNKSATVFNVNDWIRFYDDGTNIIVSQNGCAILTIPLGGDASTYLGTANSRQKTGYGFAILPFEAVTGQHTLADTTITTTDIEPDTKVSSQFVYRTRAAGVRIVDTTQASTDPTPDVGEYDLLIVSGNQPHVAQIRVPDTVTSIGSEQLNGQMQQAAVYGGQFYVVDGTNSLIIHPVKREVKQWTATDGIFPAGCEINAVWRGRMILARQPGNPTLWFMARIGKPQDYDFGSGVDVASKAFFGSSGAIGQPADPITCLAPFMDDFLIIGCQSSLYIMEGDPGAGGKLTSLNNRIGILGPRAYCFDETGTLYFVGAGGLYRLDRGARIPVPVTGRKLAGFLDTIDTRTTMVQCAYDGHSECVHVFLTPINGSGSAQHVVYEIPAQALWYDKYPDTAGPWAVCEIDGPTGNSRRVLFGGNDGYIRRFDESAKSDDGDTITSRIRFAPLMSDSGANEMIVEELEAIGAPRSGTLNWYIITGDSSDACEEIIDLSGTGGPSVGQPQAGGTWPSFDGWQTPVGLRKTNTAVQLVIEQVSATESWAMVLANLKLKTTGKNRKPSSP